MPKRKYADIKFSDQKLSIVSQAVGIVNEYRAQGYDLTLRQVYYQFVARDLLPADWADEETGSTNNQRSYKKLGDIISDARMAGLMDWEAIVDRTREMGGNTHWRDPATIIKAVSEQYMIDKWEGQRYRPEVWVEKDALEGVVATVCRRLDVAYFSCRGYTSMTSIWENAQRIKQTARDGVIPVILHLGDHDPSGIDMSRDIADRVTLFMDGAGKSLIFKRLALNMKQVEEYGPPENPAKSTDSRYKGYVEKFGDHSWELDALDPNTISQLISKAVAKYRDDAIWKDRARREADERELLKATSDRWDEVVALVDQ